MTSPQTEGVVKRYEGCSRETSHRSSIEIRTEN